jgi:hypothetical protein
MEVKYLMNRFCVPERVSYLIVLQSINFHLKVFVVA